MAAISIGITERGDAFINNEWEKWVLEDKKPAILITKNPSALIKKYPSLFFKKDGKLDGNIILHATITGLGGTPLEPNVLPYGIQLSELKNFLLDETFCKERIVIRQDPLIPYISIGAEFYRSAILEIASFAKENNLRYRTSFFDYYPHVRERFNKIKDINPDWAPYISILNQYQSEMHMDLNVRNTFLDYIKSSGLADDEIEICGEPGMKCTGCVSLRDLNIFGLSLEDTLPKGMQRPACACLGIKKELLNNKHPCAHNCAYCYWKD